MALPALLIVSCLILQLTIHFLPGALVWETPEAVHGSLIISMMHPMQDYRWTFNPITNPRRSSPAANGNMSFSNYNPATGIATFTSTANMVWAADASVLKIFKHVYEYNSNLIRAYTIIRLWEVDGLIL